MLTSVQNRLRQLLVLIPVLLGSYWLLQPVRHFEMLVYDDLEHIVYNPHVIRTDNEIAWGEIWGKPYFDLYVPVSYSLWALVVREVTTTSERQADPLVLAQNQTLARALHTLNVILHECNIFLVFVSGTILGASALGAGLGALLFGLHPLQVESVAWISECRGLLATTLGLIAFILWIAPLSRKATELPGKKPHSKGLLALNIAATLVFCAALLAKPSVSILPAMALCIATFALKAPFKMIATAYVPGFLASLTIVVITRLLQKDLVSLWPWWQRGLVALDSLSFYFRSLFCPPTFTLLPNLGLKPRGDILAILGDFFNRYLFFSAYVPDYGRQPRFDDLATLSVALLTGLAMIVLFYLLRKKQNLLLPPLLFVIGLSPSLGLFPSFYQSISTVANRYVYLAMLGPAFGLGWFWTWCSKRAKRPIHLIGYLAVLACLTCMMLITSLQLPPWRDSKSLFTHNLIVNPESFTALHGLGDVAVMNGFLKRAEYLYRKAIEVRPSFAHSYASLGNVLLKDQRPEEAKVALQKSLAIYNQNPTAQVNLGVSLQRTGDENGALAAYQAVTSVTPHPLAYYNAGVILANRGASKEAEAAFLAALKANPRLYHAHLQLARLYNQPGLEALRDRHLEAARSSQKTGP